MKSQSTQHLFKDNDEVLNYLKESLLFGHLPETTLQQLVSLSEIVHFPAGATILQEGRKNNNVYFLLQGEASVYAGKEYILSMQRVGDIFGEMSIISNEPCSASVIADTPIHLFSIRAKEIEEFTQIEGKAFQAVLYRLFATILTEKLNQTTKKAKQLDKILQSMTTPVIVVDFDAIIQTFNSATLKLIGCKPEDLFDKPIEMILSEEKDTAFQGVGIERLIKERSIGAIKGFLLAKNSNKIPILFSNSIMYDDEGKNEKIVCVVQDITNFIR